MNYLGWLVGLSLSVTACAGSAPKAVSAPSVPPARTDDDRPAPAVHKRGSDKLIVVVGKAGGTLELDNGARLLIPQGALAENTEVTFSLGKHTTAFSNHEYERPFGPTLEVACDAPLQAPFEVSVPDSQLPEGFSEQDLAFGVETPSSNTRAIEGQGAGTSTRWDYLDAHGTGGRAVGKLDQVPGYRVQFLVSKSQ